MTTATELREDWHGTYTGYASRDCRCDECKAAKAEYVRDRRRAGVEDMGHPEVVLPAWHQRAVPYASRVGVKRFMKPTVTHGTHSGYRNGCRCWDCTDAWSAKTARQRRKRTTASP